MTSKSTKTPERVNVIDLLALPSPTASCEPVKQPVTPPQTPSGSLGHASRPRAPLTPHVSKVRPNATVKELLAAFQLPSARVSTPPASSRPSPSPHLEVQHGSSLPPNEVVRDLPRIDSAQWTPLSSRMSIPNASVSSSTRGALRTPPSSERSATPKRSVCVKPQKAPPIKESEDALTKNIRSARERFYVKNKDYFLPLLPPTNLLSRLLEERGLESGSDHDGATAELEDISQPLGIKADLKTHQRAGLSFLVHLHRNGVSGVLADEMGLGKTLQTIALIQFLKENPSITSLPDNRRCCLVVCPLSVLDTWVKEIRRWAPGLSAFKFHGSATERTSLKRKVNRRKSIDVIITTYDTLEIEVGWLTYRFFMLMVLDEGHLVKDSASKRFKCLQKIRVAHRLILTGTPVQNNLLELWSMLHLLFADLFDAKSRAAFQDAIDLGRGKFDDKFMLKVTRLLRLVSLRRTKETIQQKLPPKREVLLHVPLAPLQRECYEILLGRIGRGSLRQILGDETTRGADGSEFPDTNQQPEFGVLQGEVDHIFKQSLKSLLVELRKCCSHPDLVAQTQSDDGDLVAASGKLIMLQKLVQELVVKQRKKVLIFSGFTKMLDICQKYLAAHTGQPGGFRTLRLDGRTSPARRNLAMKLLNDTTSDYRVMLISTRAGGLGITLTGATEIMMLDSDWNPQVTLQAEARAHRIGQTDPVNVYKLICQGTVEEQMLSRIQKKQYMASTITDSMQDGALGTSTLPDESSEAHDTPEMGGDELSRIVRNSLNVLSHPPVDIEKLISWDLDTTLSQCTISTEDLEPANSSESLDKEAQRAWLTRCEHVRSRIFEGQVYQKMSHRKSLNNQIAADAGDPANRRIDKERRVMIDGYWVSKESLKDPVVATPAPVGERPRKPAIQHQTHCQVCRGSGAACLCARCPRAYHHACVGEAAPKKSTSTFTCPHHACHYCSKSSANAGGLLYGCHGCSEAYCEACIDFSRVRLIGDTIPEFESLGWPMSASVFFVECTTCARETALLPENKRKRDDVHEEVPDKKARLSAA